MHPADLPWHPDGAGAFVPVGPLGALMVHKKGTDFEVVVFGRPLLNHSVTLDEGKRRAEAAARLWLAQAAAVLWDRQEKAALPEPPRKRGQARPGKLKD